ncbi:MAG TPA: 2OG-Fe(II) oxygenase [Rickettsiales bacterium]|nr:2OG-Fe(II) oxygenase [Rickettsiales bacterium]
MQRSEIASYIVEKLTPMVEELRQKWNNSGRVRHFFIDDLLPEHIAHAIRIAYPPAGEMRLKKSLRELKHIAAQMNQYNPLLEEALYAFQDPRVVELVAQITGLKALEADTLLYAGGISMMGKGHFLNPHIDNSHDKNREKYRVLNLLYYVSPDWKMENGGNLELWPEGPQGAPLTVESRFNRLAVMVTDKTSWHSVSPITVDDNRCCVSNYYFSAYPAHSEDYFHVTSFRGRPEQKLRNIVLQADQMLRMGIRKLFPKGIKETKHYYKQ